MYPGAAGEHLQPSAIDRKDAELLVVRHHRLCQEAARAWVRVKVRVRIRGRVRVRIRVRA